MAYVDTPGRVHKVWRERDVFVMEYATLRLIVPPIAAANPDQRRALTRKHFERQGIYRALRLAGAKHGDRVRMLDAEFTLDELPEPPKGWAASSEGITDYRYIVTPAIGRLDTDEVKERARELLPQVLDHLLAGRPGRES